MARVQWQRMTQSYNKRGTGLISIFAIYGLSPKSVYTSDKKSRPVGRANASDTNTTFTSRTVLAFRSRTVPGTVLERVYMQIP